jgi:hypothetical protein
MTQVWALAALWLGLALVATLLSIWLRVATALSEIVVGTVAQLLIGVLVGGALLGTDEPWVFGLTHRVIDQAQYSFLIAAVIGSAVVPTLIANAFFLPRYLLPKVARPTEAAEAPSSAAMQGASAEETA